MCVFGGGGVWVETNGEEVGEEEEERGSAGQILSPDRIRVLSGRKVGTLKSEEQPALRVTS